MTQDFLANIIHISPLNIFAHTFGSLTYCTIMLLKICYLLVQEPADLAHSYVRSFTRMSQMCFCPHQTKTLYFCLLVHLDVQLKILELKPNVKCPSPLLYSIYTFIFIFCPPPLYNASPLLCIRVDVLAFIQLSNLVSNHGG